MNRKASIAFALLVILALTLNACSFLPGQRGPVRTPSADDLVNTAAAQTVAAIATDIADGRNPTLVGPVQATITLTPTPAATRARTAVPQPSQSQTAAQGPCSNAASFVRDVTIPDGTSILPGSSFIKIWELKNTGTCTWNANFAVVFAGRGDAMGGNAANSLPKGEVKPGDSVQVPVTLRAPHELGDYEGYWMLRDGQNQMFGTGPKSAAPFFVKIHVADEHYAFTDFTCGAKWQSNAGDLPCPGQNNDSRGFILPQENPGLEDNQSREGQGWLVMPQPVSGGWIVGRFPAVGVPEHSDFRATLSCAPNDQGCYVRFRVTYQVDGGDEQVLGEWNEGNDGNVTQAVKDLNMVGGKSVAFNFYVYVSGTPDQSRAIWFNPEIVKN